MESSEQATLSAGQSGIGYKRARDTAAHSSQTVHPGDDTRCSYGWPLATWRLVLPLSLKQPPPPTSKPSMTKTKLLPSFTFKKATQASDEAWQQTVEGHNGSVVTNPTVSELEHSSSASQDDGDGDMDFSSAPRKSRLSAPQLQAQLSQLSDRTRLRRLKNTLFSKGAWQRATRIQDLCHTHVTHKWLYHLDACAGSATSRNGLATEHGQASVSADCVVLF